MTVSVSYDSVCHTASSGRTPATNITSMMTVWKQRRELARLDATRLNDLGISAQDAQREAARWFWDLPG